MIILAAGEGARLRPLTSDRPKCLIELGGETILDRTLRVARQCGIDQVVAVAGHRADRLADHDVEVVVNHDYATTNMALSLYCAEAYFGDGFILSYGDIAYSERVLRALLEDDAPVSVSVDRDWRSYWELRFDDPLADAESLRIRPNGDIDSIGQRETDIDRIEAQYMGLVAFRGSGVSALRDAYVVAREADRNGLAPFQGPRSLERLFMTDLLQGMIDLGQPLHAVPIRGGWVEIDSLRDLDVAEELVARGRLT